VTFDGKVYINFAKDLPHDIIP